MWIQSRANCLLAALDIMEGIDCSDMFSYVCSYESVTLLNMTLGEIGVQCRGSNVITKNTYLKGLAGALRMGRVYNIVNALLLTTTHVITLSLHLLIY